AASAPGQVTARAAIDECSRGRSAASRSSAVDACRTAGEVLPSVLSEVRAACRAEVTGPVAASCARNFARFLGLGAARYISADTRSVSSCLRKLLTGWLVAVFSARARARFRASLPAMLVVNR